MSKPKILELSKQTLIGKKCVMSLQNDQTSELWKSFMKDRSQIKNVSSQDLYSIQVYTQDIFQKGITYSSLFEKWAASPVKETSKEIPSSMEALEIPGGKYAIFQHKGTASTFGQTLEYILKEWLPNSIYLLDHRPQFEIMSKEYRGPHHPESIEDVYIPVKLK